MSSLIDILDRAAVTEKQAQQEGKTKTSFWASETETMAFDIFHRWMGTPPTNPMEGEKITMLAMRKLMEVATVEVCRKAGILVPEYTNDTRVYFEWGEHKVPISGYTDLGIKIDGELTLVEVKTYYGGKNHIDVSSGRIKTAYLKQLAIYQYHPKIKHGIMLMINQGTGERFEYDLYQDDQDPYLFTCPDNAVEIHLLETFQRFEKIYLENILPKVEPVIEYQYKYDVTKIKWEDVPVGDISKARNNRKVIGDWQVKYSEYKDLIIERQGTTPGYTTDELAIIRKATAGYHNRGKQQVQFTAIPKLNKTVALKPLIIK